VRGNQPINTASARFTTNRGAFTHGLTTEVSLFLVSQVTCLSAFAAIIPSGVFFAVPRSGNLQVGPGHGSGARPASAYKSVNRGRGLHVIAALSGAISIGTEACAGTLWFPASWMFDAGRDVLRRERSQEVFKAAAAF
jgi:hypothetical protein